MLPVSTMILVGTVGLLLVGVVIYVASQSLLTIIAIFTLIGVLAYTLMRIGILKISFEDGGIDISLFESTPIPSAPGNLLAPADKKEVFYVSGNDYTYDEAAAVCAAYGADLATYDEVNEAHGKGAEWCGYGWTQGGMALFPTQQSTWESLQQEVDQSKRTLCGRPGVNGGYFDPSMKFGVNCYGIKPHGSPKLPLPIPGTDAGDFQKMVEKFKSMLKKMMVSPFNRTEWSEMNVGSKTNELHSGHTNQPKPVHS